MKNWITYLLFLIILTRVAESMANDSSVNKPSITPIGIASWTSGKMYNPRDPFDYRRWNQSMVGIMGVKSQVSPRLNTMIALRAIEFLNRADALHDTKEKISLSQVYGKLAIGGSPQQPWFNLIGGLTNYNYHTHTRHLGEYLLRSGAYVPFLVNDVDYAQYKALGAQINRSFLDGKLKNDILMTSERETRPHGDFSLAYVVSYAPSPFFEFGAGVNFRRLFPLSLKKLEKNMRPYPLYDERDSLVIEDGDTLTYTTQGTVLMARAMFDPKPFLKGVPLGEKDLQLYSEIALLGVKNYGTVYDNRKERMPMMAGIHLPAFGFIDIVAFEIEYYGNPNRLNPDGKPISKPDDYSKKDDWRWAIYAKHEILPGFTVTAIAASDHWRYSLNEDGRLEERTLSTDQWHWKIKIAYDLGRSGLSYR
ncbi:MAG: hypothetical protein HQK83_12135 [Fibrobacteria bacterium]|nr:hypothetical protein [Fibrobacteria bacterium]